MKRNKVYIVYKIINKLDGKEYIGVHGTYNINDNYMGSGNYIKLAIATHGENAFSKKILHTFNNKADAYAKEAELVDENYVSSENTYNIKLGGEGGWEHVGDADKTPEALKKRSESAKKAMREGRLKPLTPEARKLSKGFLGKNHTKESREKISKNNGANLNEDVINQRIQDFHSIEKKRGYVSKLANRWGVTHTQVRRFLKQNNLG